MCAIGFVVCFLSLTMHTVFVNLLGKNVVFPCVQKYIIAIQLQDIRKIRHNFLENSRRQTFWQLDAFDIHKLALAENGSE